MNPTTDWPAVLSDAEHSSAGAGQGPPWVPSVQHQQLEKDEPITALEDALDEQRCFTEQLW